MVSMSVVYQGQLHCEATHGPSGAKIATDAPKDNHGKGEAFSPTDLVASALGACMLTVMGIVAARHHIVLDGAKVELSKEMVTTGVRRIGRIPLTITMPAGIKAEQRSMLETAAHSCPVHKSLHPDIEVPVQFVYLD